ncbi:aminotransferase class IV [Cyclobacterium marinum]|uniref:branched-chain-amino-acid transaminase n=1 Tax=Cyclobacterium marinum (strain ATCC 25205 / DSM 745 / LMG 13164 / NCIMB 1802) TaxID=880070 RepID=G0IUE0_CYCMS|nr:aminotransferase class IV [Cyclobacterium marinum]AEL24135.1 aminotransferase class IV [Cyclobacterium marinum DSM 745]MBR9776806.1 aminotransferase class IV [Cytophagales bacterium]|tara:strand:- start:28277 stop:29188 length:912 start_codon:yes stop_codon:yes gene_type:complete
MVKGTHQAIDDVRNETVKIFINGEFHDRREAKISVFDSGYLVGDGVWEAFRVHQGKLIFIDQHLDRLWQSAKVIGIDIPFSKEELINNVHRTLKINGMKNDVHVRAMLTRGIKKTPSQDPRLTVSGPNLVIIAEFKAAAEESKTQGISLFTSTIRRGAPDYLDPRLNCHSKLHEVQALIQAIEAGADEALMLDVNGFVATCNATNFFMVKGGEVWTSTGEYCMNGITRGNVIKVCSRNGIRCFQKNFSLFDVYGADEAFVTGTFGGLTPVVKIDGKSIGNGACGPVTTNLRKLYEGLVAEQLK